MDCFPAFSYEGWHSSVHLGENDLLQIKAVQIPTRL